MANTAGSFQFFDSTKGGSAEGNNRASATVIGQDVVFKGHLKSGSDVVIAGIFEGDVASEGRVTVVAGAQVVGSIAAAEVVLGGRIQGNSIASKALTLLGTADVRGDVTTPQIVIEPGATFVGRCSMPKGAA
jgi:cytoskeletal protein CcmA (bactofilin family)